MSRKPGTRWRGVVIESSYGSHLRRRDSIRTRQRERHRHLKAARLRHPRGQRRAVRRRDRSNDREAQPVPGGVTDPLRAQPLERHEQPVDLLGRNRRAGVADGQPGPVGRHRRCDLDAAAGDVVPDRIVDQVGYEAFHQVRVAAEGASDSDVSIRMSRCVASACRTRVASAGQPATARRRQHTSRAPTPLYAPPSARSSASYRRCSGRSGARR